MSINKALPSVAGLLLGVAAAQFAFATPKHDLKHTLLIGFKNGDAENAANLVRNLGKLEGKDRHSGFYFVELNNSIPMVKAKASLSAKNGVEVVLPGSSYTCDRVSVGSIDDHIAYLKARAKYRNQHLGLKVDKDDDEAAGTDWWEAYRYFLDGRTGRDGKLNVVGYKAAAAHRDAMAPTVMGSRNGPRTVSGSWQFMGPKNATAPYNQYFGVGPISGRISGIAYTNVANKFYCTGADGGVWKTTDGGVNWTPLSDTWTYMWTSSIAVDPTNSNIVYVGTGDFDGFFPITNFGMMKSTNGGASWTNILSTNFGGGAIKSIFVDPTTPSHILCTASANDGSYSGGIYRSTDSGSTWTNVAPYADNWCKIDRAINGTYWAVGGDAGTAALATSTDGGATWTNVVGPVATGESVVEFACSKVSANTLYVLTPSANKVWKSPDAGTTWVEITGGLPKDRVAGDNYNWSQSTYDYILGTTKIGTQDGIYVGLITGAFSYDGGTTWVDVNASYNNSGSAHIHSDQHAFAANPTNTSEFLTGCDGGIFKHTWDNTNHVDTTASLNATMGITQFYHIALHPTNPTLVMGGAQDNSSPSSTGDLSNWFTRYAGDGGWGTYDTVNNRVYTTSQNLSIFQYTGPTGTSGSYISPSWTHTPGFIAPIAISNDGSRLYAATQTLNYYNGTTWTQDLSGTVMTGSYIRSLYTAPADNNYVYCGSNGGSIWYTSDAGVSLHRIDNASSLTGSTSSFAPLPTNAKDVLVTKMGFGHSHLWRCPDVTAATPSWVDVGGTGASGLPDVPANCVVRDPYDPSNTWYVATDNGVFRTTNAGSTWTNMTSSLGLPNVMVNDLHVSTGTGYLVAGTYGRGMWRISISNGAQITPSGVSVVTPYVLGGTVSSASVTLSSAAGSPGQTVTLSSTNTAVATVPASVTVTSASSANFAVTAAYVTTNSTTTISATLNGVTKSAVLTVHPVTVSSIQCASTVTGGLGINIAPVLTFKAPPAGAVVTLTSSVPSALPSGSITVTGGAYYTYKLFTSNGVSADTSVTLTATYNGVNTTKVITVKVPPITYFAATPNPVVGGTGISMSLTLQQKAGASGDPVIVTASPSGIVNVAGSYVIPAGQYYKTFAVTTNGVSASTVVTLTANLSSQTKTTTVTVNPVAVKSVSVTQTTLKGGVDGTYGVVYLSGNAPSAGASVTVASSNTGALTVQTPITIAAGKNYGTFNVFTKHVNTNTSVTVTATYAGTNKTSSTVTVTP